MQKTSVKFLQEYYKQLAGDARRRDPAIAQLVNEVLDALGPGTALASVSAQLVKPLEMVLASKASRSYSHCLTILQSLAAEGILSFDHKLSFISHFSQIIDSSDDMTCIKILQILLIILSPGDIHRPPLCSHVFNLCLKAYGKKSPIVRNTALAVYRHQYSLLFSLFKSSVNGGSVEDLSKFEEAPLFKICFEQVEGLSGLVSEKCRVSNCRGVGMDILSVILAETSGEIARVKAMREHLLKSVAPQVAGILSQPAAPYSIVSRAVKLATQLILAIQGSYYLLNPILGFAHSGMPWMRYLCLEAVCSLVGQVVQVQAMHSLANTETHTRVLKEVLGALVVLARSIPERVSGEKPETKLSLTRNSKALEIVDCINCEAPKVGHSHFFSLLGETLASFVDSLALLYQRADLRHDQPLTQMQVEQVVEMFAYTWKPLYDIFMFAVKEAKSEGDAQRHFRGVQTLVGLAAEARQGSALQYMLKGLCQYPLPIKLAPYLNYASVDSRQEINFKHILVCNTILRIAQNQYFALDQNAWIMVFGALQKIANYVHKAEYASNLITPNVKHFQTIGRRVSDNLQKYSEPRSSTPEKRRSKLKAGTGEEEEKGKDDLPIVPGKAHCTEGNEAPLRSAKPFNFLTSAYSTGIEQEPPPRKRSSAGQLGLDQLNTSNLNSLIVESQESPPAPRPVTSTALPPDAESFKLSLESLFTITSQFDERTLYCFVMALGEVTLEMLENLCSSVERPGRAVEIQAFDKLNMFGLIHMLETCIVNIDRVQAIWESVSAHLDCLVYSKFVQLRLLSIDVLSCLISNIFMYYKDEENETGDAKWRGHEWQGTVLTPLLNALNAGHCECFKGVMSNLPNVLDNCCEHLKASGWDVINRLIDKIVPAVQTTSSGSDAVERVDMAFKCVEHLVHNYLERVDYNSFKHLLSAVEKFASYKGDISIPIVAVELIHRMADHVLEFGLAEASEEKASEVLMGMLGKVRDIGCEERSELRHAAYRALEVIFSENRERIGLKVWSYSFSEVLYKLIRFVELRFFACKTDKGVVSFTTPTNIATPKFSLGMIGGEHGSRIKFDEEAVRRSVEESKLKEKQWEESTCIAFSSLIRIFTIFCSWGSKSGQKGWSREREKVYGTILEVCARLVKQGTYSIISSVFKSLISVSKSCPDCITSRFEESWKVFQEFGQWIEKPDPHFTQRPAGAKLAGTVLEALRAVLTPYTISSNPHISSKEIVQSVFMLLRQLLNCSKLSEGFQGMVTPQKLLNEEEAVFQYIEEFVEVFKSEEAIELYLEFLLSFLDFKIDDSHIDAFIRQALRIAERHIIFMSIPCGFIKRLLPELFKRLSKLIALRFKSDACKMLLFHSKDSQPLWYEVGMHVVQISTFLINPDLYRTNFQSLPVAASPVIELIGEDLERHIIEAEPPSVPEAPRSESGKKEAKSGMKRKKPGLKLEIPEEEKHADLADVYSSPQSTNSLAVHLAKDPEIQEIIWPLTLSIIKEVLDVSEGLLSALEKQLAEEVVKKSQDLGVNYVDFIFKVLLPNSSSCRTEHQSELIALIDEGSSVLYSSFGSVTQFSADTLSKHCLNTLMDLCSSEQETHFAGAREKIAALAAPVLVNRCRVLISKFLSDERRNGLVPMPKQRISDLIDLMDRLRALRMIPSSLVLRDGEGLAKAGKAHLVHLMPDLVSCISSKQPEVREKVRDLLHDASGLLHEVFCDTQSV